MSGQSGPGGATMAWRAPARASRPRELQDPLNLFLYHPLAWRLAGLLARTPATPNAVSVFGGLMVVAAGFAYVSDIPWPLSALLGMALHMGWHVVDGADGDLARMTGRASPIGEIVDGVCDYTSHVVLYVLLALMLADQSGSQLWAWAWALSAGAGHILQSNHVEVERRFYLAWIHGVPWLHHAKDRGAGPVGQMNGALRVFRPTIRVYLWLASSLTPRSAEIDAAVSAASSDPARLENVRKIIAEERVPLLPVLKLLGPNPRAIVLGLGMLAGSPLWFFVYQAIVLNGLLMVSLRLHRRAAERIEARLAAL